MHQRDNLECVGNELIGIGTPGNPIELPLLRIKWQTQGSKQSQAWPLMDNRNQTRNGIKMACARCTKTAPMQLQMVAQKAIKDQCARRTDWLRPISGETAATQLQLQDKPDVFLECAAFASECANEASIMSVQYEPD